MTTDNDTIVEGNKLIADFMQLNHFQTDKHPLLLFTDHNTDDLDCLENIQYDSSWDWLMPVVEKIEAGERFATMLYVNTWDNRGRYCFSIFRELDEDRSIRGCFIEYCGNDKLKVVYTATLEFIRLKNSSLLPHSNADFQKNYLTYRKYIDELQYS